MFTYSQIAQKIASCRILWVLALLIGVMLRYLMIARGFNFDFLSYEIVADIVRSNENVYANTPRYNYGPIWSWILYLLSFGSLRIGVVTLLTLVDLSLTMFVDRRYGRWPALFFFLNPISIVITGFHNQFDNLALLVGLVAVMLYERDGVRVFSKWQWAGLLLLGISLAIKHVLFLFPLWMAAKQQKLWQRVLVLMVPILVFALSFLPYWFDGRDGIIQHVFLYRSVGNTLFSTPVWIGLLSISAIVFRRWHPMESLLIYTCILVATSPAVANQYLAIPLVFILTHWNWIFLAYMLFCFAHLLVDESGLFLFAPGMRTLLVEYGIILPQGIDYLHQKDLFLMVALIFLLIGLLWFVWLNRYRLFSRLVSNRLNHDRSAQNR